jgi:serine/threonine protein kinase
MFFNKTQSASSDLYPSIGERIGKYTVRDIAGAPGGTAIVLICTDASGKKVAIKRFYSEGLSYKLKQRIYQEAKLNINSSYIVSSNYIFEENGHIHSVMPYIKGKSLGDILACSNGLNKEQIHHLARCLAIACCDLHRTGRISSDIKSDNIIITPWGHIKLIDLTCFEVIGQTPEVSLGTEPYAAPELGNRQIVSAATDIYSIGMVLYEAIVGTETFQNQEYEPRIEHIEKNFPHISSIIEKAIQPNPRSRFPSSRSLLNELQGNKRPSKTRRTCSITVNNGEQLFLPVGRHSIGRKDIAPGNSYISEKQFEIDFDGNNARIRDAANKNKIFMNDTEVPRTWIDVVANCLIKISDIMMKLDL